MKNIKIALVALLVCFVAFSCVTERRCLWKYPIVPEIVKKDSVIIKDTIIYRDRYIPYYIKGDTQFVDKPVPVEKNIIPIRLELENDYAKAKAWVENSRLKLQLEQKDQVIEFKLDSADKEVRHWKEKWTNEKQTIVVKEKFIPKWVRTLAIVGGIITLIFLAWFGYRAFTFFKR